MRPAHLAYLKSKTPSNAWRLDPPVNQRGNRRLLEAPRQSLHPNRSPKLKERADAEAIRVFRERIFKLQPSWRLVPSERSLKVDPGLQ